MALRFLDSFDHYTTTTQLLQKWTAQINNIAPNAAYRRTGANGVNLASGWIAKTIDNQQIWIVGFAFRATQLSSLVFHQIFDAGVLQVALRLNGDGTFSLLRGATVVATTTRSISAMAWNYIEFKADILPAAGTLEVRVNEEVWATFNGNTRSTANSFANQLSWYGPGGGAGEMHFDDIYILDGTGLAPNNNYWGDTQIEALFPNGAGFYTELATLVGAPTHWQAVSDVSPDDDATYVADNVVDRRDTFAMSNLTPASAIINGIQVDIYVREDTAGGVTIARMYRNAGIDNQGADTAINTSYSYRVLEIMALDPIAAGPWTVANINSAEFGVRIRP